MSRKAFVRLAIGWACAIMLLLVTALLVRAFG
jgi:hypothetical protein